MNDPVDQPNPLLATDDPAALLKMMDLQIALQRAKRLSGDGGAKRRNAHLAGMFCIVLIVIAALGALWHLKSTIPEAPIRPGPRAHGASGPPVR